MSTAPSVYEIVGVEPLTNYQIEVEKRIRSELEKRLPEGAKLAVVNMEISDVDDRLAKEEIRVVVNVTELLGLDVECFYFDGAYEICSEPPVDDEEFNKYCDPDSKDYDDEKCNKLVDQCVQEELKQFKEENCGLPFTLQYENPPYAKAKLVVLEDEDSYRYCCGVGLEVTFTYHPFKTVMKDIVNNEKAIEYTVNQVVAETLKLVEAVKALAP